MKFVFLMGVEGAGHGLMRSILKPFLSLPTTVDEGVWHEPMTIIWNTHNNAANLNNCRVFAQKEFGAQHAHATHAFESASFPFGQPRDALRHPRIKDLEMLLSSYGVDFVPIVIYRNFYDCVHSGVRRGFTDSPALQARIIEANLFSMYQQLAHREYVTIKFETLIGCPQLYTKQLAMILNIRQDIIEEGIANVGEASRAPAEFIQEIRDIVCVEALEDIYTTFEMRDLGFVKDSQITPEACLTRTETDLFK